MYIQDQITLKNWTFNLGIRGDLYYGISKATQRNLVSVSLTTLNRAIL
jgi:hypothetical protein